MSDLNNAMILTGATGSGKTALAIELAGTLGAEIIALDSMTLYRGLDIGTAKPSKSEQASVRHHLIDVLEPYESASVAWWLERAKKTCEEILIRGKVPLFVGGTPFYLKALLHGLFESPPVDPALRQALEAEAAATGPVAFHARLAAVDAKTAARLHPNDVRRVVRALEVFQSTGKPISEFQQTWDGESFQNPSPASATIPAVMLDWPRETLYQRIDDRVDAMIAAGWREECRGLMNQPLSREAMQAVGYAELFESFRTETPDLDKVTALIKTRTRQFAKRQLTWFRKLPLRIVPAGQKDTRDRVLDGLGIT